MHRVEAATQIRHLKVSQVPFLRLSSTLTVTHCRKEVRGPVQHLVDATMQCKVPTWGDFQGGNGTFPQLFFLDLSDWDSCGSDRAQTYYAAWS